MVGDCKNESTSRDAQTQGHQHIACAHVHPHFFSRTRAGDQPRCKKSGCHSFERFWEGPFPRGGEVATSPGRSLFYEKFQSTPVMTDKTDLTLSNCESRNDSAQNLQIVARSVLPQRSIRQSDRRFVVAVRVPSSSTGNPPPRSRTRPSRLLRCTSVRQSLLPSQPVSLLAASASQ